MELANTPSANLPKRIETVRDLEELLSRPPRPVVELFGRLPGPLAVVGGAGKIGPSLARMACRARDLAGADQQIIVIDRFPDPAVRDRLEADGAQTVTLYNPWGVDGSSWDGHSGDGLLTISLDLFMQDFTAAVACMA